MQLQNVYSDKPIVRRMLFQSDGYFCILSDITKNIPVTLNLLLEKMVL